VEREKTHPVCHDHPNESLHIEVVHDNLKAVALCVTHVRKKKEKNPEKKSNLQNKLTKWIQIQKQKRSNLTKRSTPPTH
jgi:hypothetical protein